MGRVRCRRLEAVWEDKVGWSKGTKRPVSRNVLMLDMRSNEEAEGERRMMGSDLFALTVEEEERGLEGVGTGRDVSCCVLGREGCGCDDDLVWRRPRKDSVCLRM